MAWKTTSKPPFGQKRIIRKARPRSRRRIRWETSDHINYPRQSLTNRELVIIESFLEYYEILKKSYNQSEDKSSIGYIEYVRSRDFSFIDEYFKFLLAEYQLTHSTFLKIEKFFNDVEYIPTQLWLYRERYAINGGITLSKEELEEIIEHNNGASVELLNKYPSALEFILSTQMDYGICGTPESLSEDLINFIEANLEHWKESNYAIEDLIRLKGLPNKILDKLIELTKENDSSFSILIYNYDKFVGEPHKFLYQLAVKKHLENSNNDIFIEELESIIPNEYLPLHFFLRTLRTDLTFSKEILLKDFSFLLTTENTVIRDWVCKQIKEKNE